MNFMNNMGKGASLAILSSLALLAGCMEASMEPPGATGFGEAVQPPDNEILIFTVWPAQYVDQDVFERQVGQFIKQKFPDIRLKQFGWDDGRRYEDLVAAGTYPDIIMDNARMNLHRYIFKYDLQYDLTELIKKHRFDTTQLNPAAYAQMQNISANGEIYGLPYQMGGYALFYNKDIFDKFGVDYPRNGMTYDEVYELAKVLTRVDGDITYKGYSQHPGLYMTYNQLSLSPLHPTEDRANLTADGWKKLVDNLRRFYEIPANQFDSVDNFPKGNIAMAVHTLGKVVQWHEQNPQLNFDIVSMPSFADLPNVKNMPDISSVYITKQSRNKDLAFQVVSYLLSEQFQTELSKDGIVSVLDSEAIRNAYGQNLPHMRDKKTDAVFFGTNAMPPAARAEGLIYIDVPTHAVFSPHIFSDSKDTATALRLVEEAANKAIATQKALEAQ